MNFLNRRKTIMYKRNISTIGVIPQMSCITTIGVTQMLCFMQRNDSNVLENSRL